MLEGKFNGISLTQVVNENIFSLLTYEICQFDEGFYIKILEQAGCKSWQSPEG